MAASGLSGSATEDLTPRGRQSLERYLKGVVPCDDRSGELAKGHGVAIGWGEPFEPWVLRFMLVDVIGCADLGRSEKVAWVCLVAMDDVPIEVSFRKLGMQSSVVVPIRPLPRTPSQSAYDASRPPSLSWRRS